MDEQREWLKKRRKKRLRTLAVVLCFSVLAMNFPSILEAFSVYAALPDEARGQTMVPGAAQAELSVPDALEDAAAGETGGESAEGDGTEVTESNEPSLKETEIDPELGTGETETDQKPGTEETETDPEPSTGETETDQKPSTGETETDQKPDTGETETDQKPSTGETETDSKPGTGETEIVPEPSAGETEIVPKLSTGGTETDQNKPGTGDTTEADSQIKYIVTFDYQGATGENSEPSREVIYGSPYGELPKPVKTNYFFQGWYTESDGKGIEITSETTVKTTKDHTLYALWTTYDAATQFTITYNMDGGVATNPLSYSSTTKDFTLRNPTRAGYTFDGWTGTDLPEWPNTSKKVTVKKGSIGHREYTAHWTANKYTVKFNYNGATSGNSLSETTVVFGQSYGTLPSPAKNNYDFVGWFTDPECRYGLVKATDSVAISKSHTLYAKWYNSDHTYTITLKSGKGYTLKAQSGSVSPVWEKDSFTFRFELESGYRKSGNFAVKVNGREVSLSSKDTYTIQDINENKTVTVEGVKKKDTEENASEGVWENQPEDDSSSSGGDNNSYSAPSVKQSEVMPPVNVAQAETSVESSAGNNVEPIGSGSTSSTTSRKTTGNLDNSVTTGRKVINSLRDRFSAIGSTFNMEPDMESDDASSESGENSENGENGESDEGNESGVRAGNEVVQSLYATVEDDSIVLPGEPVPAGNVEGMLGSIAGAEGAGTTLDLGDGSVTVKVMCKETDCKAGVADAVAVANAVLTPEQIRLAAAGEDIEVRIDIKNISESVTEQDRGIIARCIDTFQEELPGLTAGMYIDISVFMKSGTEKWHNVATTGENIDVVIGIPENLLQENRAYYIIRAHDGGYTLLSDMDEVSDTITVSTNQFSSYAIAYRELGVVADGSSTCKLCHICPTFLGNCYFLWLGLAASVCCIMVLLIHSLIHRKVRSEVRADRAHRRIGV